MLKDTYLLIKFGEKKHLESLKQGYIYFNPIKKFRNDGTAFRGDPLEGKVPIDPNTLYFPDSAGNNIFDSVPRPDVATLSYVGDDDLLMFCCAAITDDILENDNRSKRRVLKESFKDEMRQFGDYAICFWECELLQKLQSAQEENLGLIFDSRFITYHSKSDFSHTDVYSSKRGVPSRYFVKDTQYKHQNEWRTILCSNNSSSLALDDTDGFLLRTTPFQFAEIFKSDVLLNSLSVGENNA